MKAVIWNYAMAMAELDEAAEFAGEGDSELQVERLSHPSCRSRPYCLSASFDAMRAWRNAIQDYALAFARERLAYRFGIGETAVTNIARIKAQRELFAQLAK
ncbi:hypothetical protein P9616_gp55 [Escherichia phage CEC_Kaz_2018]|uniref:Uncharacterized protein n=1 Tax=Escherichia phage CEC_Kaz_2018 TaxID=2565596 RepID=A0A4P8EWY7_9CAUD|nr:hypothetical protein P9616_gp55 [Escherichia phage CEC_Kaz_2018]QCO71651.1 hypothetical protein [Escherichia phage CEC_Kaz_2018]